MGLCLGTDLNKDIIRKNNQQKINCHKCISLIDK